MSRKVLFGLSKAIFHITMNSNKSSIIQHCIRRKPIPSSSTGGRNSHIHGIQLVALRPVHNIVPRNSPAKNYQSAHTASGRAANQ